MKIVPPPPPPDLAGTRKEIRTSGRTNKGPATDPRRRPFINPRRPMSGTNPSAADILEK